MAALTRWLPSGAAVWRAWGLDAAWTDEAHLLAFLADATQVGNWQRGDGKGPKPKTLPRPGDEARQAVKANSIAAKAERFRARERARATEEG